MSYRRLFHNPIGYVILLLVIVAIFLIFYTKWRLRGYEHKQAISGANSDMNWFVKLFFLAVVVSMIAYAVISSFL